MIQSYIVRFMTNDKYISNLIGAFASSVSTAVESQVLTLGGRSLSHESALVAINNHPNETIDVLSKVLALSHSGAVRLINTLEQEGLVARYKSVQDARSVVLRTTQQGAERVEAILSRRESVTFKVLEHFSEDQKKQFSELLETAMAHLTDKHIEARRICRMCDEGVCRKLGCPVEKAIK
jgi:DNA-binding MarR family transcriptional regulator